MKQEILTRFFERLSAIAREYNPAYDALPDFDGIFEYKVLGDFPDLTDEEWDAARDWYAANRDMVERRFQTEADANLEDARQWAATKRSLNATYGIF